MTLIRERRDSDIDALCDLIRIVHAVDGYPVILQDDVRSFVVTENVLAAWVCEVNGRIVGHVGLHTVWSDEVAQLACSALARSRDALAAVSRLFVDVDVRRRGIGRQLLDVAAREAHDRALLPVLDVVTTYVGAIELYEGSGWVRLGTIAYPMPNGKAIDEHVYAQLPMEAAAPRWSVVINCSDIERMSEFWCALLGLTPRTTPDSNSFRVLEGKHGLVALQVADDPVTYRHQMHVDIYCPMEKRELECDRVRALGARYVRESADPADPFVVFTDPEGNEFCVAPVDDERRLG